MGERQKTGGRVKGVPNKQTQTLQEISERLECNPFEILLYFAKGDHDALGYEEHQILVTKTGETVTVLTISPELRQKSAKDACEYLHPKRKALEHSGSIEGKSATLEEFLKQQSDKLKEGK